MKILSRQVLRGPNMWSNYRTNLIQVRLDLEDMEYTPTDKIPGFRERIEQLLPRMIEHECSEMCRGGFFTRISRGTWMGHVIEHVALEIQYLAGMDTGYGRTRGTGTKGIYNLVFSYEVEQAGLYAVDAAFRIVNALINAEQYDIEPDIAELRKLKSLYGLGPSTKSIVDEATKRGIPFIRRGNDSTIQLGYGKNQMSFRATISCKTSALGVDRAADKDATKRLLSQSYIPVPKGDVCSDQQQLQKIIDTIGYPLVVKPLKGNQGKGASIDINNWNDAKVAFDLAKAYGKYVVAEKYIPGFDYRFLVIGHKFVAAAKRLPAHVVGNGNSTVDELINIINSDPKRGVGHENVLTQINVDLDTLQLLAKNGFTLSSIPDRNEIVVLKTTANLSTGGTAIDVTDDVHPENIAMAERISRVIGLDICGIDIMAPNVSDALRLNEGAVIEVNAAPGFRMHLEPSEGKSRNVAAAVVDMLYPPGTPSRIPIVAITGTNGKTTTTRLMAHLVKSNGYNVGYTTTDGIYIGDYLVQSGDTTGPVSSKMILSDPTVDFAVLETARGGLLRSGLSFNQCDIGIITNIKEDHLGLKDINTIDDLANVKAVVVRSVKKDGWAILNAEDPQCVKIAKELRCNVAYFSLNLDNITIQQHISEALPVAVYSDGYLTIINGKQQIRVAHVNDVPLTCDGKCDFNISNVLATILGAYLHGFTIEQIQVPLSNFKPGIEQTPGRLNLFEFKKYKVLVDYAHNPHGYRAMESYLKHINSDRKIGIITGVGDRRDQDITECGVIAGRIFDHIIIRLDKDLRGSSAQRISDLLISGIVTSHKKVIVEVIPDELEAVHRALGMAEEGDYLVFLSEAYRHVVNIIKSEIAKETSSEFVSVNQIKSGTLNI